MSILNLSIPTITVLSNKTSETQWDISRVTSNIACPTIHTVAEHNLKAGEKIYIYGSKCGIDGLRSVYQVFDNKSFTLSGHDTTKTDGGGTGIIIRESYMERRNEVNYC